MCGPTETDLASEIIDSLGIENCNSLSSISISNLIPIITQCDIYIGNDSFGHHVMSQAGKPCFVVLLDTPRAYTDYSLNQFKILPKNIDANMIDHDSKISPLNISVDHVLDKIKEIVF